MAARLRAVPDTRTHLRPVATPDAPQARCGAVDAAGTPEAERARRGAVAGLLRRLGAAAGSPLGQALDGALSDAWRAGAAYILDNGDDPKAGA